MGQPDYRVYELNKRLQQHTEVRKKTTNNGKCSDAGEAILLVTARVAVCILHIDVIFVVFSFWFLFYYITILHLKYTDDFMITTF